MEIKFEYSQTLLTPTRSSLEGIDNKILPDLKFGYSQPTADPVQIILGKDRISGMEIKFEYSQTLLTPPRSHLEGIDNKILPDLKFGYSQPTADSVQVILVKDRISEKRENHTICKTLSI